jgi:anti-sigma-K factor RskA
MSETDPNDDIPLAAEYVLGLLDAPSRTRAEERLRSDGAFRMEVEAWERRFAPLTDEVAPRDPPAEVWDRIARSLEHPGNVVSLRVRPSLWNRAGLWRATTAASLAAAAVLAIFAVRPSPAPPVSTGARLLAATLAAPDGKVFYVATLDASRSAVVVTPVAAADAGDRAPELWLIAAGGKPRPVGLLAGHGPQLLPVAATLRPAETAKAVLAVSLEPLGGSPTGVPTGPVIASGVIASL